MSELTMKTAREDGVLLPFKGKIARHLDGAEHGAIITLDWDGNEDPRDRWTRDVRERKLRLRAAQGSSLGTLDLSWNGEEATTRAEPRPARASRSFPISDVDEATRSVSILASTPNPVEVDWVNEDGKTVQILEAIESWDLSRFEKNPVLLWAHDSEGFPVGTGDDVEVGDFGLKMRAKIASKEANPLSEQLWNALKEKLVRAVSVGFESGEERWEEWEGKRLRVISNAILLEVSFCSLPKDEDAGVVPDSRAKDADTHPQWLDDVRMVAAGLPKTFTNDDHRKRFWPMAIDENGDEPMNSTKMDAADPVEYAREQNRRREQNAHRVALGLPVAQPDLPPQPRFDAADQSRFLPAYRRGGAVPPEARPVAYGARGDLPPAQQAMVERERGAHRRALERGRV